MKDCKGCGYDDPGAKCEYCGTAYPENAPLMFSAVSHLGNQQELQMRPGGVIRLQQQARQSGGTAGLAGLFGGLLG